MSVRVIGFAMIFLGLIGLTASMVEWPVTDEAPPPQGGLSDASDGVAAADRRDSKENLAREQPPSASPEPPILQEKERGAERDAAREEKTAAPDSTERSADERRSAAQQQTGLIEDRDAGKVNVFERNESSANQAALPWAEVSAGDGIVTEGADHISFVITLSEPAQRPIIIIFTTVDGSALSNEDYRGQRGTVTFEPGVVSAEIRTALLDDQIKEKDEQFSLVVNGAPGIVNLRTRRATATIKDND